MTLQFPAFLLLALALASGFSGGSLFSRAYVRRFGEAPSLTRGRAVRAMT
jgi:transcriptional regulator GlxA family with amidase domain